jgi:hypothetical protein
MANENKPNEGGQQNQQGSQPGQQKPGQQQQQPGQGGQQDPCGQKGQPKSEPAELRQFFKKAESPVYSRGFLCGCRL